MNKISYQEIGFKCGIEIHQQLETHKLFCNCPSITKDDITDVYFERQLRAVVGETGEIDRAAAYEQSKNKKIKYIGSSRATCLVEYDEEPPREINREALEIVIQIAKMLNATIVDEIQVMRKTVIDGSNVSGFQRTALVAVNGYINTSLGKVNIPTICLEEEAAQKVEETDEYITYRLDRLGIPLVEIATDASIKNPEHAKEVAEKIGLILRATNRVKRGIGSIRQDVNLSIKGHPRVEIKGFQELRYMPKVIENEVKRQLEEIKKGNLKPHVRKANPDGTTTYLRPMPGSARLYPETDVMPIKSESIKVAFIDIDAKIDEYIKKGLDLNKAKELIKSNMYNIFDRALGSLNLKPNFIVEVLLSFPKEIKREHNIELNLNDDDFYKVLKLVDSSVIPKGSVKDVLIDLNNNTFDINKYKMVDENELLDFIKQTVNEMKGAPFGAIMGKVMSKYRGKADGKNVSELIKKLISS